MAEPSIGNVTAASLIVLATAFAGSLLGKWRRAGNRGFGLGPANQPLLISSSVGNLAVMALANGLYWVSGYLLYQRHGIGFAAASLIGVSLISWPIFTAITVGERAAAREMLTVARQRRAQETREAKKDHGDDE